MKSTDMKFWDSRYRIGKTPWDFGGVPIALIRWLATASPGRALIPASGSGYEVREFHARGWDVWAVDYSPAANERARRVLGTLAERIVLADFFTHDFSGQKFDVVYERTFLCSLPPEVWPQYVQRVAELLVSGGRLVGFFLYGHEDEPPPYPLTESEAQALFGANFTRILDEAVTDSLPLFAGRERWQIWQKKAEGHRP
ncbi:MAG TPA: methyltransferase domain-containing protein [Verrucomicrobiae bacterium]|nr:methyltransferase domain-containing protein [Verrucomicrobiae bacterium]